MKKTKDSGVLRAASIVGAVTALSRVLGLAREVAMGYFFGTSALKSAFDLAFVVPNLFRRLFGEGALTSAFVPIFSETLHKEGRASAFRFAWKVLSLLILFLLVATGIGVALTWPLAKILPEGSRWILPMPMLRVMLPYALLICVAAVFSGILNTLGKFAIPAFVPLLLNAVWLGAMFALFPFFKGDAPAQMRVLCWTVLAAGILQAVFLLPMMLRAGGRPKFHFKGLLQDSSIRRVASAMAPAAIGGGLIQINVCLDKTLAFYADASGPAALEYAERLVYLPMGMFATAFVTVLLPTFSRQAAANDLTSLGATLERSMRQLSLIMAPCSVALLFLAEPIIQLIYGIKGGNFDAQSTLLSARALAGYAPGLLLFSFQKTLTPAFYGMQDMKTPLKVSILGICVNVCADLLSVWLLPTGWKHVGIALATCITSLCTATILSCILFHRIRAPHPLNIVPAVCKMLLCASVMGVSAKWFFPKALALGEKFFASGKLCEIFAMSLDVALAMVLYFALIAIFDRTDLKEVVQDFLRKPRRK